MLNANDGVRATGGSIDVRALSDATSDATTAAASLALAAGGIAGSISGAGAFALNVILTSTKAHIDSSKVTSLGAVFAADETSSIDAFVLAASAAIAGGAFGGAGAIGASIARNQIGWATFTATTAT